MRRLPRSSIISKSRRWPKGAERLLADSGWLPEPLRTTDAQIGGGSAQSKASTDALPAFLADVEVRGIRPMPRSRLAPSPRLQGALAAPHSSNLRSPAAGLFSCRRSRRLASLLRRE